MAEPKIMFADSPGLITQHAPVSGPTQTVIIHGVPIAISPGVGDVLAAYHFGFEQAKSFYLTMVQPPPAAPTRIIANGFTEAEEEDELAHGIPDLASIWQMPPEAREAVLSRYGLTIMAPVKGEPDPTHENMRGAIEADGLTPPAESEEED